MIIHPEVFLPAMELFKLQSEYLRWIYIWSLLRAIYCWDFNDCII